MDFLDRPNLEKKTMIFWEQPNLAGETRCKHEGIRRQYQVKLDRKLHETYNHYQTYTKLTKLASALYIKLAKLTKLIKETRNPLFSPYTP